MKAYGCQSSSSVSLLGSEEIGGHSPRLATVRALFPALVERLLGLFELLTLHCLIANWVHGLSFIGKTDLPPKNITHLPNSFLSLPNYLVGCCWCD